MQQYITVYEAAQELKCHPNTVRNYIRSKKLKRVFKKSNVVLVHRKDVQKIIDDRLAKLEEPPSNPDDSPTENDSQHP